MADHHVKAMTANIETPVFETTAFTTPKPLGDCKVAIVTTASLHHPDDDDFEPGETGFRVLSSARRDYMMGHWSPNFDATGFAVDINTVFPIDRLDELSAGGVVGAVAEEHLSYAGNQFDLSAVRLDSGPAGAKRLLAHGVDVVLLTPV
jgi:D-proline reductase (dithiol) PrdB